MVPRLRCGFCLDSAYEGGWQESWRHRSSGGLLLAAMVSCAVVARVAAAVGDCLDSGRPGRGMWLLDPGADLRAALAEREFCFGGGRAAAGAGVADDNASGAARFEPPEAGMTDDMGKFLPVGDSRYAGSIDAYSSYLGMRWPFSDFVFGVSCGDGSLPQQEIPADDRVKCGDYRGVGRVSGHRAAFWRAVLDGCSAGREDIWALWRWRECGEAFSCYS